MKIGLGAISVIESLKPFLRRVLTAVSAPNPAPIITTLLSSLLSIIILFKYKIPHSMSQPLSSFFKF